MNQQDALFPINLFQS